MSEQVNWMDAKSGKVVPLFSESDRAAYGTPEVKAEVQAQALEERQVALEWFEANRDYVADLMIERIERGEVDFSTDEVATMRRELARKDLAKNWGRK
ncbi:hypothetical protein [Gracilibacillus salinarum]|uniref:CopG family transcriptional regulator n=1 Tax=Gracilibacillus salinarum TaxID=2932255 RepID=A0ABY4GPY8_9BACI|nr:hypothetical protein [Gracilibacillus salinarum]UOQ86208.1 hypothetical protein MUN87_04735 [Gracilibacillus salinarum]